MDTSRRVTALALPETSAIARDLAEEAPIALHYGGMPHAVMMATPADLNDFAAGFTQTEAIGSWHDIRAVSCTEHADGMVLDINLAPERLHAFLARRRTRQVRGHTSCGLCGVEDIADAHQDLPMAPAGLAIRHSAIIAALAGLEDQQSLKRQTRATHGAAFVAPDGTIRLVREDVGRHNALDKLIGAVLRAGMEPAQGFCLITSRCSYEMVQKALLGGFATLVAISAPTALAVRTAQAHGLTLVAQARPDHQTCYAGAPRIVAG